MFVNEPKLSDMRQMLQAAGHPAEFSAGIRYHPSLGVTGRRLDRDSWPPFFASTMRKSIIRCQSFPLSQECCIFRASHRSSATTRDDSTLRAARVRSTSRFATSSTSSLRLSNGVHLPYTSQHRLVVYSMPSRIMEIDLLVMPRVRYRFMLRCSYVSSHPRCYVKAAFPFRLFVTSYTLLY